MAMAQTKTVAGDREGSDTIFSAIRWRWSIFIVSIEGITCNLLHFKILIPGNFLLFIIQDTFKKINIRVINTGSPALSWTKETETTKQRGLSLSQPVSMAEERKQTRSCDSRSLFHTRISP